MPNLNDCTQNAAIAFDFLTGKGLTSEQAAAVIGNLQVESGLSPALEATDINNKTSRGIAMWQPPRWQDLLTFAYSKGFDPKSLEGQLEFLWHELEDQPSLGLRELARTTSIDQAVVAFQNLFERCDPAYCHTDVRIRKANAALSCLTVRPPLGKKPVGFIATAIALVSLAAAAGYGAYKALPIARRA